MITNPEKSQIKSLLQSPAWGAVEQIANQLIAKIAAEPKIKDTEWDTLKATLIDEGQITGIKRIIQELYNTLQ